MEKVTTMSGRQSFMNVRQLTIAGLLTAVTVFLGVTGYGFIPLGFMNATILHVPTIIAALTGGRRVGMTVGFMFGVFSRQYVRYLQLSSFIIDKYFHSVISLRFREKYRPKAVFFMNVQYRTYAMPLLPELR